MPNSSCLFLLGREYNIPSPLQRLLAEMVDFFILFFIKATIILSVMQLSGIKSVPLFSVCFWALLTCSQLEIQMFECGTRVQKCIKGLKSILTELGF